MAAPELALPGEPRPEYAPGYRASSSGTRPRPPSCGVGVRTIRRWAAALERDGPAGLVDDRWRRCQAPLAGADDRAGWTMARQVLAEHTDASTPTQDLVLARIAARLDAEHGAGVVPVPGRTRARALLREISRGTSAFGGAEGQAGDRGPPGGAVRAAAGDAARRVPAAGYHPAGRVRDGPGDTALGAGELTAAMDLFDRCITGLRLTPVSTKAVDAAAVLFESIRPLPEPAAGWADVRPPYHGLPAGR